MDAAAGEGETRVLRWYRYRRFVGETGGGGRCGKRAFGEPPRASGIAAAVLARDVGRAGGGCGRGGRRCRRNCWRRLGCRVACAGRLRRVYRHWQRCRYGRHPAAGHPRARGRAGACARRARDCARCGLRHPDGRAIRRVRDGLRWRSRAGILHERELRGRHGKLLRRPDGTPGAAARQLFRAGVACHERAAPVGPLLGVRENRHHPSPAGGRVCRGHPAGFVPCDREGVQGHHRAQPSGGKAAGAGGRHAAQRGRRACRARGVRPGRGRTRRRRAAGVRTGARCCVGGCGRGRWWGRGCSRGCRGRRFRWRGFR